MAKRTRKLILVDASLQIKPELVSTCVGWPNGETDLCWLTYEFELDQSQRKSSQIHTIQRKWVAKRRASRTSTCESVWPLLCNATTWALPLRVCIHRNLAFQCYTFTFPPTIQELEFSLVLDSERTKENINWVPCLVSVSGCCMLPHVRVTCHPCWVWFRSRDSRRSLRCSSQYV